MTMACVSMQSVPSDMLALHVSHQPNEQGELAKECTD